MKKIVLISLLSIYNVCVFAQLDKFELGVEGGGLVSMLRGSRFLVNGQKAKLGTVGGVFVQYNFNKRFAIKTAFLYENKLAENKSDPFTITDFQGNDISISNYRINYNFQYLNIPLLLKVNFGEKKLNYFINVGPYLGLLLKQSITDNYTGTIEDTKDGINTSEFGLSTGFGLNYQLTNRLKINFEARNNFGTSNMLKNNLFTEYGNLYSNTMNGFIGISYKLGE